MFSFPSEIVEHIMTYVYKNILKENEVGLYENLIFVNKYFRKMFIDTLNSKTLNNFRKPFNSYTYYPSYTKEILYQYERANYKRDYKEPVVYNGIEIGRIERSKLTKESANYIQSCHPYSYSISRRPYWRCYCYVFHRKYTLGDFYDKQFRINLKMDVHVYQVYHENDHTVVAWYNKPDLQNHLTQYFTKEMTIEQMIYHHKQMS